VEPWPLSRDGQGHAERLMLASNSFRGEYKYTLSMYYNEKLHIHVYVPIRVTRLGEFSPIGRLLSLGKKNSSSPNVSDIFSTVQSMH
jgi:hypothetical protein